GICADQAGRCRAFGRRVLEAAIRGGRDKDRRSGEYEICSVGKNFARTGSLHARPSGSSFSTRVRRVLPSVHLFIGRSFERTFRRSAGPCDRRGFLVFWRLMWPSDVAGWCRRLCQGGGRRTGCLAAESGREKHPKRECTAGGGAA